MSNHNLRQQQRRNLERRYASSARYLRTVEGLLAAHPGDAFYTHQATEQRALVERIRAALVYSGGSPE